MLRSPLRAVARLVAVAALAVLTAFLLSSPSYATSSGDEEHKQTATPTGTVSPTETPRPTPTEPRPTPTEPRPTPTEPRPTPTEPRPSPTETRPSPTKPPKPTHTATPTESPVHTATPTTPAPQPTRTRPATLPRTGADAGVIAALGGLLLAGGATLAFVARRRSES